MLLYCLKLSDPKYSRIRSGSGTEGISASGGVGEMGERGGWRFIALCIFLIESLSFLLALHCLCCSTSISLCLLHILTNRLINFLMEEEERCLCLCYSGRYQSDRSWAPVRPVPVCTAGDGCCCCSCGVCCSPSSSSISMSSSASEYL